MKGGKIMPAGWDNMNKYSLMEARIASICRAKDARCVGNGAHRQQLL